MSQTDSQGFTLWPRGQDQWNAYAAQRAEAENAEEPDQLPAEEVSWQLVEPMSPEEEEALF